MERIINRVINALLHGALMFLFFCLGWSLSETGVFTLDGEVVITGLMVTSYVGTVVLLSVFLAYCRARLKGLGVRPASRGSLPASKPAVFVG